MNGIKFSMAARCEAAGRTNNEDNFQLTDNLANDKWSFMTDHELELGEKGALLIVCDGMGGMNAGEVASKMAVETIKEWFAAEHLTPKVTSSAASITRYIHKAILAADAKIKEAGKNDREKEGMGSTIVLAWIIGQSVFVGWCGDSRCYRFDPVEGLKRLSHDHSYVQNLVDSGKLSEELAFDHPESNIITRSLGDTRSAAKPEVKEYPLRNGDIIMLCSDGLSGVLRDREIEAVMSENIQSMASCRDELWDAARNAGWHDNVTIGLCRILSGCEKKRDAKRMQQPVKRTSIAKQMLIFFTGLIVGIVAVFAVKYYVPDLYAKIKKEGERFFKPFELSSVLHDSITVQYLFSKNDTLFIHIKNPNTKKFYILEEPVLKRDTIIQDTLVRNILVLTPVALPSPNQASILIRPTNSNAPSPQVRIPDEPESQLNEE